ncbi:MAG: ABC transporter ATP-binding protein [Sulfobacillus thermosulfidooxidans]|uniref:ABC transporter ATP-binding protein n=1 Tax=Sulfobacillus thermotolerans TaxID=338644 RepID=A0ABM6RR32_9FIRM|nr:ABC transporter ATP-binding protein [Sulfobacillus sp. hq2]AUW93884.1 ABC transporter ATP-binding protein [Sulfobacillus thermotolerans]MCY0909945.1 ABC transporter ATP-binding protein [Sulfobacillus thermotolerans]POB11301.1 ABC transporter ATP-binding protein [Sulfobacillus sp. hq2]PSR35912.1 MAG: ABC transporter ATP-binding protein [Sulfobacillus thermosulfidooxidans]
MAILEVAALSGGYGTLQVLSDITFVVDQGQQVVLLGANGAGKTTLLKTVVGLLPAWQGHVKFGGDDVVHWPTSRRVRAGMAFLSEIGVIATLSIEENLKLGAYYLSGSQSRQQLDRIYQQLPLLKARRKQAAGSLSGGQRKILGFAKALMGQPRLILMDEPSSGLAPVMVNELLGLLETYRRTGPAFLIAEQNIKFLQGADHVYVLDNGRVHFDGSPEELDADTHIKAAYFGLT